LSELTKQLELLTKQFDHITTTAKSVIIRLQKIYVKNSLPHRSSSSDLYNQMNDESYLKAINRSVSSCGVSDLSSEATPIKTPVSSR
jgi:hypothetical protein